MARDDVTQEFAELNRPLTPEEFENALNATAPEITVTPDDEWQRPDYLGTEDQFGVSGSDALPYTGDEEATKLPEEDRGVLLQNAIGAERGWINGSIETWNSVKDVGSFIGGKFGMEPFESTPRVPEEAYNESESILSTTSMRKPEAMSAQLTESTSQFLQGFLPAFKAVRLMQKGTQAMKGLNTTTSVLKKVGKASGAGAVGGAMGDFAAFNPTDERLSNWAKDSGIWGLDNAITQYLSADPNDTALEGRMKQMIEGMIAGKLAEGVAKGVMKTIQAYRNVRIEKAVEAGMVQRPNVAYIIDPATGKKKVIASETNPKTGKLVDPETLEDIEFPTKQIPVAELPVRELDKQASKDLQTALLDGDLEGVARIQANHINLAHVNTEADIKDLIEAIGNQREIELPKVSRSWKQAASEAGTDLKTYSAKVAGLDTDVQKAMVARNTLAYVAQDAARIAKANPTPQNLLAFQQAFGKFNIVSAMVDQNATEIARALHIMASDQGVAKGIKKALVKSGADNRTLWDRKLSSKLISPLTGRTAMDDWVRVAQFVADSPDSNTIKNLSKAANQADWTDALNEIYINSLFTVKTITTNVLATGTSIGGTVVERYIGAAKNVGNMSPDSIGFREANAYLYNMVKAIPEAFVVFGKSYWKNAPVFSNMNKEFVEEGLSGAFAKETFGITAEKYPMPQSFKEAVTLGGTKDTMMRTVGASLDLFGAASRAAGTKMLMSTDEGMKALVYRGELHALVQRELRKAGLKPHMPEFKVKRQQMLNEAAGKDPKKSYKGLSLKAMDEAHIRTFTEELGQNGRNIQGLIRSVWGSHIIVPFMKTPVNLIKYVFRRTPFLAEFSAHNKAELAAGGARAQLVEAQITAGTMAYIAGAALFAEGNINGDVTSNWNIARNNETLGIKPRAFKFEDGTQIQVDGFDGSPFSFPFLSATVAETIDEYIEENKHTMTDDELLGAVGDMAMIPIQAYAKYAGNSTWLQGVGETMQIMTDSNMDAGRWASNKARDSVSNMIVPNSMRWLTETLPENAGGDPYAREVETLVQSIQAKLPAYNKEVAPRADLLGEPAPTRKYLFNSVRISKAEQPQDPLRAELKRLQEGTRNELVLGGGIHIIGSGKDGVRLKKEEQWNAMQFMAKVPLDGVLLEDALKEVINDPEYQTWTDTTKEAELTLVYNDYREQGKDMLLQHQYNQAVGKPEDPLTKDLTLYPYSRKTPIMTKRAMQEAQKVYKEDGNFGEVGKTRENFIQEILNDSQVNSLSELTE